MIDLITIPLSAMAGITFAELSGIPQAFSNYLFDKYNIGRIVKGSPLRFPYRLKPFDCSLCLAFWVCFSLNLYLDNIWALSFVYGLSASYLSVLLKKLL